MQLTMSLTSCQLTAASRLMTMFQHSSSRAAKSTCRREENVQDLAQDDSQYDVLREGWRAGSKALGAECCTHTTTSLKLMKLQVGPESIMKAKVKSASTLSARVESATFRMVCEQLLSVEIGCLCL